MNLSREIIVGIYNGSYPRWDDPDIVSINPGVVLPPEDILVVARADTSGSTEIFTKALCDFSTAWSEQYGAFSLGLNDSYNPYYWDSNVVDYYGVTSTGVVGLISSIRYTLGYVSLALAKTTAITYADIINKAGTLVTPSPESITSAVDEYGYEFTSEFTLDITDGSGAYSYPLSSYTYIIVHLSTMSDCTSAVELWRYIDWFLYDDHAKMSCVQFGFVPLNDAVTFQIQSRILNQMKCNGESLASDAQWQKLLEIRSTEFWRKSLMIVLPMISIIIMPLLGYVTMQQFKIHRAIIRNEWKVMLHRLNIYSGSNMEKSLSRCFSLGSLHNKGVSTHAIGSMYLNATERVALMDQEKFVLLCEINLDSKSRIKLKTKLGLLHMKNKIHSANLTAFFGLCYDECIVYSVSEFCSKGSLNDILQNESHSLDDQFKFSLACDICRGMVHLHNNGIIHGTLSSHACYLDHRWNVKIGDWYLNRIAQLQDDDNIREPPQADVWGLADDENIKARTLLWTPPERLNDPDLPRTKEGDVYAFAILLVEIFTRDDPYCEESYTMEPVDIIDSVKVDDTRPQLPMDFPSTVIPILSKAWHRSQMERPSFREVKRVLDASKPSKKSVLDCMMEAMEDYTIVLEEKVAERTHELQEAIQKTTDLLHKMLPPVVARKLSEGKPVAPEFFDSVTIFFSDIVGFTSLASESTPLDIVAMLNDLYTTFDDVVDQHNVYKVETIGDAYMVISGAPERNRSMHAAHVASMALDLATAAEHFVIHHKPDKKLEYRAGIHSGSVCTGVVGIKMPRYCIFGDTVNTASRMESTSLSGKIQLSQSTKDNLGDSHSFILESRGAIVVKVCVKYMQFVYIYKHMYLYVWDWESIN